MANASALGPAGRGFDPSLWPEKPIDFGLFTPLNRREVSSASRYSVFKTEGEIVGGTFGSELPRLLVVLSAVPPLELPLRLDG